MKFAGVNEEIMRLFAGLKELEKQAIKEVQSATVVVVKECMKNTPVWEGEVVRNFNAGVGGAAGGGAKAPIGGGDPGPTNSMPLGSEPRRPANEAAALGEIRGAVAGMRALQDVFIGNASGNFNRADSGAAPTPQTARNPGGIVRPALSSARGKLRGNWK